MPELVSISLTFHCGLKSVSIYLLRRFGSNVSLTASNAIRIDMAKGFSEDRAYAEDKTNQAGKRSA